jgi:aspartyl-tRNA(Asn)/glutamyl-tRNA(Gln) amidotransferase subunit A
MTGDERDWAFSGLAALSRGLRAKDLSPVDLVESCLARIGALDGRLGAFVHVATEAARTAARVAAAELAAGRWRGPLHGIPCAVADVVDTRGIPTALGVPALAGRVPERDATVAARLSEAGALVVGKVHSSAPAATLGPADVPAAPTRSPWDPGRPAGGPSPGAAAAVAAGLVPFAIAAAGAEPDTAAAECGVTSLRPTYGVLSRRGAVLGSFTLGALGPVARSAEDSALVLDTLAGADPRDASSVGAPPALARLAAELPKGLRVGVLEAAATEAGEAWRALEDALRGAGALLAPAALPDVPWVALAAIVGGAEGTVIREDVLGGAAGTSATGPHLAASAADYVRASRVRGEAQRALARLLERHDLLLAPAPRAPAAAGAPAPDPLAAAIALGGLPAVTVPIGVSGARPVAARLVAPPLEEARLLSAVAIFQSRSSHHLHRPPLAPDGAPVAAVTRR